MMVSSSWRLGATILAVLAILFCGGQLYFGVQRVLSAKVKITQYTNRDQIQDQISPSRWLMHAGSHGAAGAGLQARLRASARSSDVSLTRVGIQPQEAKKPGMIRATAQASGNTRAVTRFMFELENNVPALIVQRARITSEDTGDLGLDLILVARAQIGDNP